MNKTLITSIILFFLIFSINAQKTVHFKANDGVKITADLYMTYNTKAPFIILYHQAGFSRGEYRSIAPKLNELGFNCMAIDQRSGKEVNGVINKTHLEAVRLNKPTEYIDAIPDIQAAYLYVKHGVKPDKIILWGSSYSAAIVFFLGSTHYNGVDGILAFSPGEYFKINGKKIETYAKRIECPVFITSAKNEKEQWKNIYNAIRKEKKSFLPNEIGKHGSKALWKDNNNNEAYWAAVKDFLLKIKT